MVLWDYTFHKWCEVTYPSTKDIHKEDEIIDRFNAYVRGPLHDSLMCSMGRETDTCQE
jgi:hypothetical protein